jgi:hypothetical protein
MRERDQEPSRHSVLAPAKCRRVTLSNGVLNLYGRVVSARAYSLAMSAVTLKEWLAEHPPPDSAFKQTLALVSERVRSGENLLFAVREFLDEFGLLPRRDLKERAIVSRPLPTGDPRADAYLGALAEHLATAEGIDRPGWAIDPDRFLDRFWFVPETRAFWALAIVESPAAFRRRGIFISEGALQRV